MSLASWLKLGFIVPSTNFVVEPELYSMVPSGVSAHFSRLLITERDITASGYPRIWDESNAGLPLAVEQLISARVSCVAYAVTAGSFFGGRRWEEELRAQIDRQYGVRVTSTAHAIVRALEKLGVRRVAVATAYEGFLNAALGSFLHEYGVEVLSLEGLGNTYVQQPASESYQRVLSLVREANSDDAEAIVISCAGLSVVQLIEPLERELRKPVVTSNQAVFWSALRLAGYGESISGFGILLKDH